LIDRSQWREVAGQPIGHELKDTLWAIDVLELVVAEIAQGHAGDLVVVSDPGCRAREEHLPAVRDCADSGGAMDGNPV
jgi:hypothetical protein